MNKQILIALTLCMISVGFASADDMSSAIIGIGTGSDFVTMPISVTNGMNVGSIHVNLTFNPEIVTVTGVTKGNMDSMMPNIEDAGDGYVQIIAYQASNPGLNGNFDVAQVTFNSVSSSGSCPLGIDVITFKDATPTGNVMAYTVSNGEYVATSSGGGGDGTYPPGSGKTPAVDEIVDIRNDAITVDETNTVDKRVTPIPKRPSSTASATAKDAVPGFMAVFAIAGLLAIAYVKMRSRK